MKLYQVKVQTGLNVYKWFKKYFKFIYRLYKAVSKVQTGLNVYLYMQYKIYINPNK